MDVRAWTVVLIVLLPVVLGLRKSSYEDSRIVYRRGIHYHTKRHMLQNNNELKRRPMTQKPRELRKKPSGNLKPLDEDDMENDEVVSVAVGPPLARPKYDKSQFKHVTAKPLNNTPPNIPAVNLVKDVLSQLGREFLTRQISEDFVFGQYVGNAMKNLTSDLRLKMQHDILELVVTYQKMNRGDFKTDDNKLEKQLTPVSVKEIKTERKLNTNDTDENWPDFSNLAKIVGRR